MTLLVSLLLGINSIMYFEEAGREQNLPPVVLPQAGSTQAVGVTELKCPVVTVAGQGKEKTYYCDEERMESIGRLTERLKTAQIRSVIIRGDRLALFSWEELIELTTAFTAAGVKQISFATAAGKGDSP